MTLKQARDNLDNVLQQVRLTREEHRVLSMSLELLYNAAQEKEENGRTDKRPEPV